MDNEYLEQWIQMTFANK